jgi:transcriptional regulator with XRE-family HTH domain
MTSLWAWLAYDLRFYRNRAKMSGDKFGQILGVVRSTVSKYESGKLKIDEQQASKLDEAFGTGGHFLRLLTFAKLGHDPDWFKEHVSYEARASMLKIYELSLVPGLLQTEAYARACFEAAGVEDVDDQVALRLARQESLNRRPRPMLWVLLSQSVLDWPVGGLDVMREQLAHLLNWAAKPSVVLRVIPRGAGAFIGLDGAFKLITVTEGDMAYTEAHGGGRLILATSEVRTYGIRYDRIGAKALPDDSSRQLIKQVMEAM